MSGNQSISLRKEPLNLGLSIFAPISSASGSATLFLFQPLLAGNIVVSSFVIIVAELLLFLADRLFHLERMPVFDVNNGQIVQMPISELQEFLKWMAKGTDNITNSILPTEGRNAISTGGGLIGGRGFLTPETPEAPLIVSITITGNYSNLPYSPTVSLLVPIIKFPGLKGALPLLILGLVATILVRAVVTPDSAGAKPLAQPEALGNSNNSINLSPNDLLQLLSRFGKHFGSK